VDKLYWASGVAERAFFLNVMLEKCQNNEKCVIDIFYEREARQTFNRMKTCLFFVHFNE